MQRIDAIRENARKKSVKPYVKIKYNGEVIKLSKKKMKNLALKSAIVVISLTALMKIGPSVYEKIDYALDVKEVSNTKAEEARDLLIKYDLNDEPKYDNLWFNDYSKITELSTDDLYGFYQYFGYSETEKVLGALGYNSWYNYLSKNGYYDNQGYPSVEVWENYEESDLVNEKRGVHKDGKSY